MSPADTPSVIDNELHIVKDGVHYVVDRRSDGSLRLSHDAAVLAPILLHELAPTVKVAHKSIHVLVAVLAQLLPAAAASATIPTPAA